VLQHVLEQDLIEARVLQRPGSGVQVVDDVGVGLRRQVDPHGAGMLLGAAADIQGPTTLRWPQIELRRIGQTIEQAHVRPKR
jgi:hypothetical protein